MLKKIKLSARDWLDNNQKKFGTVNGPKKLTMCKTCHSYYYNNAWHFEKPEYVQLDRDEEVPVRFTECIACLELEEAMYESETDLVWRRA